MYNCEELKNVVVIQTVKDYYILINLLRKNVYNDIIIYKLTNYYSRVTVRGDV